MRLRSCGKDEDSTRAEAGLSWVASHLALTGQVANRSFRLAASARAHEKNTFPLHMNMQNTRRDAESTINHLAGYPSLAAFIASDRDRTTFIYKRFDELAARNLLYLQSELAELHSKQRAFDQEDLISDMQTKQCARNFTAFEKAALQSNNNTKQKERWELATLIRKTLKEYREALLFESTLAALPPPSKGTLHAFRQVYYNQADGKDGSFPTLGGSSADLYDDIDDLVALRVRETSDRLTNFAHERLGFLFPVSGEVRGKSSHANGKSAGPQTFQKGHRVRLGSSH
jgi:hypothetical protein